MLITIIQAIRQIIYLLVLVKIILSYFMDPLHPFRKTIDSLVDPLLYPIQQVIPPIGGFDFSPLILILVVEIIANILLAFV